MRKIFNKGHRIGARDNVTYRRTAEKIELWIRFLL